LYRGDEIAEPGRITDQIITAIEQCDFIIADVTGSNPNVMFELGYARALKRPAVIINQDLTASPFDIAEMRQIVYDRARLVNDLRPQVVTAVKSLLARLVRTQPLELSADDEETAPRDSTSAKERAEETARKLEVDTLSADAATSKLEAIELEAEMARGDRDISALRSLALEAKQAIDSVDVSTENQEDLSRLAGQIGDVAVEFHNASLFREAEDLFNRALRACERHAGLHIQYALYHAMHKKDFIKADELLKRAEELGGDPSRIEVARARIDLLRVMSNAGKFDPKLVPQLKERLASDPNSFENFAACMLALQHTGAWEEIIRIGEDAVRRVGRDATTDEAYKFCRTYADAIAISNDPKHEEIATNLYAEILATRPRDNEVLSNYATIMMKGTIQDQMRALQSYLEAYQIDSSEPKVQRGLSRALQHLLRRKDLATKVLRGQPISDDDVAAIRSEIAERAKALSA
jgi:nucleoside 2-deoxyribosyltransferase